MEITCEEHVLPMFCACSFHGNYMNNLLSYCGLIDAKIGASDIDLPVQILIIDPRQIVFGDLTSVAKNIDEAKKYSNKISSLFNILC